MTATEHPPLQQGLAAQLRARTATAHTAAERGGIVNALLRGRADRNAYALYLRNLLPAYQELETGLQHHAHQPAVEPFARPELFRAPAIARDLSNLCGPGWETTLPLLPEGLHYARRVAAAALGQGSALIGHAYTRYLGDLSGAQILRTILERSLNLTPQTTAFFTFPDIADPTAFKNHFRDSLDRVAPLLNNANTVLDAAVEAFTLNIAVSEAVASHAMA